MAMPKKSFAGIKTAAENGTQAVPLTSPSAAPSTPAPSSSPYSYDQMKENQRLLGPTGPSGPIDDSVDENVLNSPAAEPQPWEGGAKHPVYDSQDGEDKDTGHAHLMHDIGTMIQEMMSKDPDTHKSISDLMEEFMGKGVDYDAESKRLRGLIEARKTPKAPNWVAAGVGSWAGGPEAKGRFQDLQDAAQRAQTKKQQDIEDVDSSLLKEHVEDLRARGKSKEALLMGLVSNMVGAKKAEDAANLRRELQERSLGAAAERIRVQVEGRRDVADKDRTQQQVMQLYESLLKQSQKDITGAVTPLYTADQAMDIAMNSILPKVKQGVETVKTGQTPQPTTPAAPVAPAQKPTNKFAAWRAQQAAAKKP